MRREVSEYSYDDECEYVRREDYKEIGEEHQDCFFIVQVVTISKGGATSGRDWTYTPKERYQLDILQAL